MGLLCYNIQTCFFLKNYEHIIFASKKKPGVRDVPSGGHKWRRCWQNWSAGKEHVRHTGRCKQLGSVIAKSVSKAGAVNFFLFCM